MLLIKNLFFPHPKVAKLNQPIFNMKATKLVILYQGNFWLFQYVVQLQNSIVASVKLEEKKNFLRFFFAIVSKSFKTKSD